MKKVSENIDGTLRVRKIQQKNPEHRHVMNVVLYEQVDLKRSIRKKILVALLAGTTARILYVAGASVDETLGVVIASPPAIIAIVEGIRATLHRITEAISRYAVTKLADKFRGQFNTILAYISKEIPELAEEVKQVSEMFPQK